MGAVGPSGVVYMVNEPTWLPFLKEDKQLLHAIASSAAWVLELAQGHSTGHSKGGPRRLRDADLDDTVAAVPTADLAKECTNCGTLFPSYTVFCANCQKFAIWTEGDAASVQIEEMIYWPCVG